jgi:hypothetical protein
MKKFLLGAVAALAIAAPGVASAQSGYVDLGYNSTEADIAGLEGDADGWTLGGATAWGGNGSLGVQLDGVIGTSEADSGGDATSWTLGGHIFTRNDGFLFGGFANYGDVDADGGGDFNFWTVGAEGQLYLSRTTLDGALSYGESDDLDGQLTAVDVGATHFFADNFSANVNFGLGSVESDLGGDADVNTYGVGAEYGFTPAWSVFGGWQHAEIEDLDSDADTLGIGVRYNWGGSLFERNRNGASLSRGGGLGRFGGLL